MSEHTLEHFQEVHRPQLFYRGQLNNVEEQDNNLMTHAEKVYAHIMEQPMECMLSPQQEEEVHKVVLEAHRALA